MGKVGTTSGSCNSTKNFLWRSLMIFCSPASFFAILNQVKKKLYILNWFKTLHFYSSKVDDKRRICIIWFKIAKNETGTQNIIKDRQRKFFVELHEPDVVPIFPIPSNFAPGSWIRYQIEAKGSEKTDDHSQFFWGTWVSIWPAAHFWKVWILQTILLESW